MKTYSILFAEDVPHYRTIEIEAENDEQAITKAKQYPANHDMQFDDPDWNNPVCQRIVHMEDDAGHIVISDIPLDNYFLRNGGEPERKLSEGAAKMLDTLRLAKNPHWVHNAALTNDIEALRRICLYYCEWWNTQAWPLIHSLSFVPEAQGAAA